jgi:hypothetical protein
LKQENLLASIRIRAVFNITILFFRLNGCCIQQLIGESAQDVLLDETAGVEISVGTIMILVGMPGVGTLPPPKHAPLHLVIDPRRIHWLDQYAQSDEKRFVHWNSAQWMSPIVVGFIPFRNCGPAIPHLWIPQSSLA